MTSEESPAGATSARLERRLEREREARLAAESIAERTTRDLYEKQQEVLLLQSIASAANEAISQAEALQFALDEICGYTGWPVGHVYIADQRTPDVLQPTSLWHLPDDRRFDTFRQVTEAMPMPLGIGLPGRVFESGQPAWIVDVNQDPNFPRAKQAKDIGVKAGLGFPVLAGAQVLAVLEFFSSEAVEPDKHLLRVLAMIGTQLGRVLERSRAEETMRASERRYRLLFERNLAAVFRTTLDGHILACNEALARLLGYDSPSELIGRPIYNSYVDPRDRDRFLQLLEETKSITNFEVSLRRKDGTSAWALKSSALVEDDEPDQVIEGTMIDITDRKRAEETMRHLAYHDALTGLPNRALFEDRFAVALAQAHRNRQRIAIMSLDLDRFKLVNDMLGHAGGDSLLVAVSERLRAHARDGDTLARVGGDEFMLLIVDVLSADRAARIAEDLIAAFNEPVLWNERPLHTSTSIGIAIYPDDAEDAAALVKQADAAMYRAKELGRNNYQLYAPEMNIRAVERLALEAELRRAIDQGEFVVFYQPQFEIKTGHISGVEALVRWEHPSRGIVEPDSFIPLAEDTGLILPLGEWVLRRACTEMRSRRGTDGTPLHLAVNVSMRQFEHSQFVATVARALHDTGIEPGRLELEITEGIAMRNGSIAMDILRQLRELGIRISVDDFGTGYSSLRQLVELPIDTLKIDRSFVLELGTNPDDATVAANIISMGHGLGLTVIAEGVETTEQLQFLEERLCDSFQGYLGGRPMPVDQLARLIRQKRATAA